MLFSLINYTEYAVLCIDGVFHHTKTYSNKRKRLSERLYSPFHPPAKWFIYIESSYSYVMQINFNGFLCFLLHFFFIWSSACTQIDHHIIVFISAIFRWAQQAKKRNTNFVFEPDVKCEVLYFLSSPGIHHAQKPIWLWRAFFQTKKTTLNKYEAWKYVWR